MRKIIAWVNKSKETGDRKLQHSPSHAIFPWAAVNLVLEVGYSLR